VVQLLVYLNSPKRKDQERTTVTTDCSEGIGKVIQIDEARVRDHPGELVRGSVEETLNTMLDAEADRLCNARRYERTEDRRDT